jgi:hypothetical protein
MGVGTGGFDDVAIVDLDTIRVKFRLGRCVVAALHGGPPPLHRLHVPLRHRALSITA